MQTLSADTPGGSQEVDMADLSDCRDHQTGRRGSGSVENYASPPPSSYASPPEKGAGGFRSRLLRGVRTVSHMLLLRTLPCYLDC